MGRKSRKMMPLTTERPMLLLPSLAAEWGVEAALILSRAHELMVLRGGWEDRFGRICFTWDSRQRAEDFKGVIKRKTLSRAMMRLTGMTEGGACPAQGGAPILNGDMPNSPAAEAGNRDAFPLLRFSWKDAGKTPDQDWYSVNYEAVERVCSLFSTASVGEPFRGQNDPKAWSNWPRTEVNLTTNRGQNGQESGQFDHASRTRASSKELRIANKHAGARAGLFEADNSNPEQTAAAIAALAEFGIDAGSAADLIRSQDGPAPTMAMADNARRLRAGGFRFNDQLGAGFVIAGVRGRWHRFSDDEVKARIDKQRRKGGCGAAQFNVSRVTPQEHARAIAEKREWERREKAVDALADRAWAELQPRIAAEWMEIYGDDPIPANRANLRLRSVVQQLLFGVMPAAETAAGGAP